MKETIEISQEDLTSDPTKDPLYQERLKEWNTSLRQSITKKRKVLLTHLKQTFSIDTTQATLRSLSWTHAKLSQVDFDYSHEFGKLVKGVTLPATFGFNKQESYHQTHFINACLLSVLRPHTPTFSEESYVSVSCVYDPELTTSDRLEEMEKFYHHLLERVPDHDRLEPQRKITITHVYDKILDIERKLEDLHGLCTSVPKGTSKT